MEHLVAFPGARLEHLAIARQEVEQCVTERIWIEARAGQLLELCGQSASLLLPLADAVWAEL